MNGMIVATKGWIKSQGMEVATHGIISTWAIRVLRIEILEFVSKFTKQIDLKSKFLKGC